jgi:hypothetical protein
MATEAVTDPPTERSPAAAVAASREPRTPDKEPAAPDAKADQVKEPAKPAKAAKPSKGAKAAKSAEVAESGADGPSVAAHPRAVRAVARAKSWGGLLGFLLGGYLSLPTNTLAGAGVRALLAGVLCYVATWAGAVFVWRRLVMLEIKGREQQLLSAAAEAASVRRESAAAAERPKARAAS